MAAMGGGGGKLGKAGALRGMGGKLGLAGALTVGALSIGSTLMDSEQSGVDKAANITKDVGTIGGGLVGAAKGAALGAAIGSVVPILGTAVGGILGSIVGGIGGSMAGNWLGEKGGDAIRGVAGWFGGGEDTPAAQVQAAAATSQNVGIAPQPAVEDNRTFNMQITQRPGEDEASLARRIMDMIKSQDDAHARGALYDPI
jgi:phage tail tape-measure protein